MSALESLKALAGSTPRQLQAAEVLGQLGLPGRQLEDWKYLSLKHPSIQNLERAEH